MMFRFRAGRDDRSIPPAKFLLAAVLAGLTLSGCATRGGPIPYDVENFGAPDPVALKAGVEERIFPLDKLQIDVFRVKDLSGEYEVALDGTVSMPLIGSVEAVNRTPAELSAAIAQRYDAQYLRDPQVSVVIDESEASKVTVDGGVGKSGTVDVRGSTDLMTVIASSGGIAEDGNAKRVAIFRKIDGETRAAAFDLTAIRDDEANNPTVYPGDIVYVDTSQTTKGIRDVLRLITQPLIFYRVFR